MSTENMIGRNVRKFREQKGMSQSDLARKLGYSSKTVISKLENGHEIPRPGKIKRIAAALGVTYEDVMGWTPSKYGHYTLLIKAYEDADIKTRQIVCMNLDIPLIDVEKSTSMLA